MPTTRTPINLPETGFPMKADLAQREPEMLAAWEEQRHLREAARDRARPSALRAARRPAVRERRDPPRPRGQQGAQGHRGQVAHARRLRLAVRAGLGLPRPADRTRRSRRSTAASAQKLDARSDSAQACREFAHEQVDCSAATSSASACSATGIDPYLTMESALRGRAAARARRRSSATDTSTRASSRCTGASTAARRWPRPRSNTRTRPRPRSTCASRRRQRASCARRFGVDADAARRAGERRRSGPRRPGRCRPTRRSALGPEDRIRAALGVAQRPVGVAGARQRAARCVPRALRPRQGPGAGAVRRAPRSSICSSSIRSCRSTCP